MVLGKFEGKYKRNKIQRKSEGKKIEGKLKIY